MIKKKILFISSSITAETICLGIAGGEVRLSEIIRGFIKDNWEVHFLTNGGGELFCKNFKLTEVINHSFNITGGSNRLWFTIFTIKIFFQIPKNLKNFDGYIYTANELLFDIIPALRLKIFNKNKWIAIVHWMPPLKFWQRKKSKLLTSLLFMMGERLSVFFIKYYSDLVLAVSEPTKKQLLNFGIKENKVSSVRCGVNLKEIFNIILEVGEKNYDAVFMKRIQAVKGVFDLIDIWKLVINKRPNSKLAIIGGGIDNKKIIEIIKKNKLERNIIFLGPIFDFKKKFITIAQSKMFILPSYEENWAIVMGEAMACKIPVLAYNLSELIEVWRDSFEQIPLGNKEYFADKIIEYLDNRDLRNKQAEIGYNYVQKFEWSNIAQDEINLVENI